MYHWKPRFDFQHPPGSYEQSINHPFDEDQTVKVGISHEHRFAFYFWGRWLASSQRLTSASRPDLVTIDWHRDLAMPSEKEKEDLESLDITDSNELSLFCWGYLNPHNDGHVLSAAYKNLIGNIYVLCKQKFANPEEIIDYQGNTHNIAVFDSKTELLDAIQSSKDIFFDLDLDYFTETDSFMGKDADVEISSDRQIFSLFDPQSLFIRSIYESLFGFTIALEPEFCGGYRNSCYLYKKIDQQLFDPPLLHPACDWKHR